MPMPSKSKSKLTFEQIELAAQFSDAAYDNPKLTFDQVAKKIPAEGIRNRPSREAKLQAMSEAELLALGKDMHKSVYPRVYGFDRKPTVSSFSIQLDEARKEWRKRHPKQTS
jgi:hypothetical protein